jgi:hypothetical protein
MVSLVDHAHADRTPAATAWVLCSGTAVVLGATMLVAATLLDWRRDPGLYRPLAALCAAVAVGCLGVGWGRPAPLLLGVALVALLCIPWVFAVTHRLAGKPGPPPSNRPPSRDHTDGARSGPGGQVPG